ncbi:chaperone for protein-folding within the ER, fungal-domain-containing protein [Trametes elegans]|nr:chaperone for protein-folding within the ER, fungal-domain-containing protein [Trametes elegans]
MFIYSLLTFALAAIPSALSQSSDPTVLVGTWSSGSGAVVTGQFANPANMTFNYPLTAGVGFAFSDDGYYELARYRFNSNGSQPACITGVLQWSHGKYVVETNGSLTLHPLGDGFQQVQDPCAAESNFIEDYNITELFDHFQLFQDPTDGPKLHLFEFDGTPVAPLFQLYSTPNMLPTEKLRNVSSVLDPSTSNLLALNNNGARSWTPSGVVSLVGSVFAVGLSTLFY